MGYIVVAAGLVLLYIISTAVYQLYLSPLAKIPGPKLAALTSAYSAYHDLFRGGQYMFVIEEMHRKYGPIVRVRPDVVHVNDVYFIDKIYTQSPKHRRERFYTVLQLFQSHFSMLPTKDHDLHRRRRAALNPYFSHQNVRRLMPVITDTLTDLLRRMEGWARDGRPVQFGVAYQAATKDVIQTYAFGELTKSLDMEDCNAPFFQALNLGRACHLGPHMYWLATALSKIPPAIMFKLIPAIAGFANLMNQLFAQIDEIRAAKELPEGKTIFHEILRSDIAESEKTTLRLGDEAMVLIVAGTDTTAATLAALTYHLLADRVMLSRLRAELISVMPDPNELPSAVGLDGLPFLNAVIQEALRLYPGATHRQDRMAPDEDIVYERADGKTFVVPAGTGIGMTAPIINRHPDIYQEPNEFRPDRYIQDPKLSRHMFTFSRGGRQCIGMNLALQELQTFTAGIFRKYDLYDPTKKEQSGPTLELYETMRADISLCRDYVTAKPYDGSKGLRVLIRH